VDLKSIMRSLLNIGLSAKMGLLVIVGTLSMISLFAYLGTGALDESTQRNLQERVVLAQMSASYMDALLENIEGVLSDAASESYWADSSRVDFALEQIFRRAAVFSSRVLVVDNQARVIASKPLALGDISLADVPPIVAALNGTPFAVSRVVQSHPILGSNVFAATPIRDANGKVTRALVAILVFNATNTRAFAHPIGLGQTGYMDLITMDGVILASTRPERVGRQSDHEDSLMGMIRDHRQAVSACHDCHTSLGEGIPLAEVLAFAPLNRAAWGITIRQSESEVFASTRLLQSRIFGLMTVMLMGALTLVYLTTRSVIVPVQDLTEATRRIAAGDLDSPLKTYAQDEVGVLARSFDEMRVRLKESNDEIQALNRELDARVQERTAQYEAAARENARLYAELQRKEQARGELLHRVISAQEDERKRIARELHDETSQSLSAFMIGLETAQVALEHNPDKVRGHLKSTQAIADTLLKNIHRLIADLRPSLLDDLGLVPAIAWFGEQRLNPLGIHFRMEESGLEQRLSPVIETAFFRIVQEALTNTMRYAHAQNVCVKLMRKDGSVTLQVSDDGIGFDPQMLQPADSQGQGLGLRGMQERASILGGTFDLQTAPGKGTIITVRVPVPG
jgi:signal transduction histidine kinase